ncbi:MAG: hypothetical protein ACRDRG_14320 [Pseudonocardiaceae bacterium]
MNEDGELSFKVGLLGPARVGKTSIVATMLDAGQQLLTGTPVTMRPGDGEDDETEDRISRVKRALLRSIRAEEFTPGSLGQTQEKHEYRLRIDPGVPGAGVRFDLLDFPGEWLDPVKRLGLRRKEWEICRRFITQSTVLIIPVDASVLMEADLKKYQGAWPYILTIDKIEEVAGDWASERHMKPDEPGLLVFCPVKCESYFADNGGWKDNSQELFNRFADVYGDVLRRVRAEAPKVRSIYCPVDTLGCVELIYADWIPNDDDQGGWRFKPTFAFRSDPPGSTPKIKPKGVDDILVSLCSQLLTARRIVDGQRASLQGQQRRVADEIAGRREGLFKDMWLWISGERDRRRKAAEQFGMTEAETLQRVKALEKILTDIAGRARGSRTRDL